MYFFSVENVVPVTHLIRLQIVTLFVRPWLARCLSRSFTFLSLYNSQSRQNILKADLVHSQRLSD